MVFPRFLRTSAAAVTIVIIMTAARIMPTDVASRPASPLVFISFSVTLIVPMSVFMVAMSPWNPVIVPCRSPSVVLMVAVSPSRAVTFA